VCKAGCADKRKQRSTDTQMAVGQRIVWVQACNGGRWGRGRLPPACMLAGSPPQNSSGLRCRAGREQAGGPGREQAACPPACTGCVRGLDTHVPPTTAAHTRLPGQALGHSLPASLLPLLPQSFSFGSTDGIRTRVSVGPEREGIVAPLPLGHPWGAAATHLALVPEPNLYAPGFIVVPSCPSPRPTGTDPQLPHWLGASLPALGLFPLH